MKSERSRLEVEMDSIEQIVDVTEYDSLLDAIADVLDSKGWGVYDKDTRDDGELEIERTTRLTGHDLSLTIDLRGKDIDSSRDWMDAVRHLVHNWDPVEEALIMQHGSGAPQVDRIIDDFKSTYVNEIRPLEGIFQAVTDAWDEKTQSDRACGESLDQMCEVAAEAVDEPAATRADVQLDGNVAR